MVWAVSSRGEEVCTEETAEAFTNLALLLKGGPLSLSPGALYSSFTAATHALGGCLSVAVSNIQVTGFQAACNITMPVGYMLAAVSQTSSNFGVGKLVTSVDFTVSTAHLILHVRPPPQSYHGLSPSHSWNKGQEQAVDWLSSEF